MTLLQLANLFNITAFAAVLIVYAFVLRRHPARFFGLWTVSLACMTGIAVVELVASLLGHGPIPTFLEVGLALVCASQNLQAGYALRERPAPRAVIWGLASVASGLSIALLLAGSVRTGAVVPSILLLAGSMSWLGFEYWHHARSTLGPGVAWFGVPFMLDGAWILSYPLLADTRLYWLGFVVSALLNILMGVGMLVLFLDETAQRLQTQNRLLEAAQTELKAAQAELERRNADLAHEKALIDRIVSHVPSAILYLNPDLTVRWVNPFITRQLGRPLEELIGKRLPHLFPSIQHPSPWIEEALRTGQSRQASSTYTQITPDGPRRFDFDTVYVPLSAEDGSLEGLLVMAFDMSARAENERLQQDMIDRLREVDRLKGDFINAASHELRTPLTSILGYSEFLEDGIGGELSTDQQGFVDQIREGALRLRRIVDDLLDFARLEAGTFTLVPQESDLCDLIRRELMSLKPQADEARLLLVDELPDGCLTLRMDARRIGQVILNLVGNAIKFTPPGGRITVRAVEEPGGTRIEVADTGIGIAPEHQDRLFEKFFQVDPSTTRERGGAGLGLSICKALIQAHGGEMGVESAPGMGSTFWFTLPRVAVLTHG